MKHNITINLPDAYRIKIEKSNEFEKSIFLSVYKTAKENLLEILYDAEKNPSNNFSNETLILNNDSNNIICFAGERGQGKSSSMISFLKALTEKKNNDTFFVENEIIDTVFTTIELIDPSLFKGKETLFEIILAKMFSKFKHSLENVNDNKIQDDDRRKLVNLFQKVFENLKYINNRDGIYTEDSLDSLIKLSTSSNLKESFEELVEKFLQVMSKDKSKFLVIAVDDFDLKTEGVYDMLEDVRRFLISKNIILLIACKLEQLRQSVEVSIYSEFLKHVNNSINTLDKIVDYSEIKRKATKYIEKLIPENRRINLPELSNLDLKEILSNEKNNNNSANSLVLELLYERLNLFLKEEDYNESILLKSTLRSLITLLIGIKKTDYLDKNNSEKYLQAISDFKNYIKDFLLNFIDLEDINYVLNSPNDLLNFRVVQTLSKKFDYVPAELKNIRNYHLLQNGDLYAVFYKIDSEILDDDLNFKWYQSFKILYMIKQLNHRIVFNNNEDYDTFNRASLININLFPEDFLKLPNSRDWIFYTDSSKQIVNRINKLPIDDKIILASFIESLGITPHKYKNRGYDIFTTTLGSGNNAISTLYFSIYSFFTAPYIMVEKMKNNYECSDKEIENLKKDYNNWRNSRFYYLFNNLDFVSVFYDEFINTYYWLSRNKYLKTNSYYHFLYVIFTRGITRIFDNLNEKYPYLKISIEEYHNSFKYAKLITEDRPALKELIDIISNYNTSEDDNNLGIIEETNIETLEIGKINVILRLKETEDLVNFLEKNKSKDFHRTSLEKFIEKIDAPLKEIIFEEKYYNSLFKSGGNSHALENRERLITELKNLIDRVSKNG